MALIGREACPGLDRTAQADRMDRLAASVAEAVEQRRRMTVTDPTRANHPNTSKRGFLRLPLFRLLAINLAAGVALAALLVGGLLALDPGGLRHLIFADRSPATALGLLLFGFVVTFGSTAMGTAIMAMGRPPVDDAPRGPPKLAAQHAFTSRGTRRPIDPHQ